MLANTHCIWVKPTLILLFCLFLPLTCFPTAARLVWQGLQISKSAYSSKAPYLLCCAAQLNATCSSALSWSHLSKCPTTSTRLYCPTSECKGRHFTFFILLRTIRISAERIKTVNGTTSFA